ncbi:alpha/beta hydrolase [Dongia rigui]|uniref:Alpha/beta hydrolase n=1 Tax=Dongia rigui TaxID=940149 RepID=A0ABU5E4G2_9PROT|nr:alpha/beta hydrolase [Dongia rigui]MDY0874192.1 alpha/beta hydrolase [Dongia rigui]
MPEVDLAALSDEALNQHFMPRIAVPDHESWLNQDLGTSARIRTALAAEGRARLDCRYGPGPRQLIDLFPATSPEAPILVWIHGGYWRALSKEHYTNIVPPFLASGAAVALVGYDLCPTVSLTALLAQTRDALRWVRSHAAEMQGHPDRITLAGNSAGAHICAMALQHDWPRDGFSPESIRAAALITGIYDIAPVLRLPVQQEVRLTADEAIGLSPLKLPILSKARTLVSAGANEPALWVAQSRSYHEKLIGAGAESALMIIPERHHFSITRDLSDAQAPLTAAVTELLHT